MLKLLSKTTPEDNLAIRSSVGPNAGAFLLSQAPAWDRKGPQRYHLDNATAMEQMRHRLLMPPPEEISSTGNRFQRGPPPPCFACGASHDHHHDATCSGFTGSTHVHNLLRNFFLALTRRAYAGTGCRQGTEPNLGLYFTPIGSQASTSIHRRSDFYVAEGFDSLVLLGECKVFAATSKKVQQEIPANYVTPVLTAELQEKHVLANSRRAPKPPSIEGPYIPGLGLHVSGVGYDPSTFIGERHTVEKQYASRWDGINWDSFFVVAVSSMGFFSPRTCELLAQLSKLIVQNESGGKVHWSVFYRDAATQLSVLLHRAFAQRRIHCRDKCRLAALQRAHPDGLLGMAQPYSRGVGGAAARRGATSGGAGAAAGAQL